ncbi:hypothetical protein [Sphingomonas baiyangensis]|uniref:hypothetical protein n=1 Tax=Sphingomonas baiyangensis TaxID=2572576 RepID=UPI001BAFA39C|nr:hypothetical protein [Sphingomonas baiyangensis]
MAYAAQTVGIEQDKLGDILKDVRDRVGDFLQTGGGPMADFFEKVAPKVGITAEAFRNLSGPDALQLFVSSLQKAGLNANEMTFYMEAMASDATLLLPLLQDNGKALAELGRQAQPMTAEDIARFKEYTDAQRQMDKAMQGLTITLVRSGLLNSLTKMVQQFTDLAARLSQSNPETVKWGIAIAGVSAALGPALIAVGGLVSSMRLLLPLFGPGKVGAMALGVAFRFMLGPIGLVATAVGAAVYAFKNWDQIKPYIDRALGWVRGLYEGVKTWLLDKMGAVVAGVTKRVAAMVKPFRDAYIAVVGNSWVPDMVDGIRDHFARLQGVMVDPSIAANDNVASSFESTARSVTQSIQSMVNAIKAGDIGGLFGGILDTLGALGVLKGPSAESLLAKGNGITSADAVALPGFANGGAMKLGGFGGVDTNVLSLNGRGIARVSRGENMYIDPGKGGARQRQTIVQVAVEEGALFRPVVTAIAGDVSTRNTQSAQMAQMKAQRRAMGGRGR